MNAGIAILSLAIVLYAAVAVKLGRWSISMPMVFVAIGFVLGPRGVDLLSFTPQVETIRTLTEVALALLLFTDASRLTLSQMRADADLLLRLLAVGLPLTIILGAVLASVLLPGEGIAFSALLGSILAPTDAALGSPIFNNTLVPARIREALSMESGLNDGIATPIVSLCLAVAAATAEPAPHALVLSAVGKIVIALIVGACLGVAGGWLLVRAHARGWTAGMPEQLAVLALGLATYAATVALNGNGFVAAFAGGILFAAVTRNEFVEPIEFVDADSTLLSALVWTMFGSVLVPIGLRYTTDWRPIAYAVASLTVVRMLPVAVAMMGAKLRWESVVFMGWFGPRGLVSVVFTLLAFVELETAGRPIDILLAVATWTVLLSVFAHGLSAQPLSTLYARRVAQSNVRPAEDRPVSATRARHRSRPRRSPRSSLARQGTSASDEEAFAAMHVAAVR